MCLYADAVYLDAVHLEHSDHSGYSVTLGGAPHVEIIVIEFGVGVILMGKLECQAYHLIAVAVKGIGPQCLAV